MGIARRERERESVGVIQKKKTIKNCGFFFFFLLSFFFMKNYTVEVGPEQPQGGRTRRSIFSPDALVRVPAPHIHTLYDVLVNSAKRFPDRKGFGFRKVDKVVEEEKEVSKFINGEEVKEKKTWKYFQLSPYFYLTYREASRLTHDVGAGLVQLGLREKSKIEVFSPTK